MNLHLRPILSSLRHHRLTAGLLALQVALTCAIVANAVFMIAGRIEHVRTQTGIPEDELSMLHVQGLQAGTNVQAQQQTDLAALRAIPGVVSAAAVGWVLPLSGGESSSGSCASQEARDRAMAVHSMDNTAGCEQPTYYKGSRDFMKTLGARLIAGRDFHDDEYKPDGASTAIITRSLAQRLWPDASAIGKTLYAGDTRIVVGVIDDIARPMLRNEAVDHLVALVPEPPNQNSTSYLLRSAAQDRERVLHAAADALAKTGPLRLIPQDGQETYAQIRHKYFQRDTTMIGLLLAATLGLLFVTALGIGGLANFWVQQRTRQIGIRRAIGATRGDILRYFQIENSLIVGAGVVLGMLLAFALNQWLMGHYELQRLPWYYLPIGACVLWLLGQLSVLWPARRAADVPPAIATRSA